MFVRREILILRSATLGVQTTSAKSFLQDDIELAKSGRGDRWPTVAAQ